MPRGRAGSNGECVEEQGFIYRKEKECVMIPDKQLQEVLIALDIGTF